LFSVVADAGTFLREIVEDLCRAYGTCAKKILGARKD
jgi:hypothetical protein